MNLKRQTVSPAAKPVKNPPIVSLTTDFGTRDPFVGIMKGVILGRCRQARLVDLTHDLPPQDLLAGCLALESAYPYFPEGTIHLAVVDPGVGTCRTPLVVCARRATFVVPDNGLLSFLEDSDILAVHGIENPAATLHPVSRTFHGRDVFAPAAALLAAGAEASSLGPRKETLARIDLPQPHPAPYGICGEILTFDRFGNAVTNLRLPQKVPFCRVRVAGDFLPLGRTYADESDGVALALIGSTGRLEISVNRGSARELLGLERGQEVRVILDDDSLQRL